MECIGGLVDGSGPTDEDACSSRLHNDWVSLTALFAAKDTQSWDGAIGAGAAVAYGSALIEACYMAESRL